MNAYLALEFGFLIGCGLLALRWDVLASTPVWVLAFLGPAVLRLARSLSYNEVFAWLRAPFTRVGKDSSGAGDSVEPRAGSVIGGLLACPICTGTWGALVLALVLAWMPAFGRALVVVLGAAGVSELLHWWSERQEWAGRAAREQAGDAWLRKNDKIGVWSMEFRNLPTPLDSDN